MKEDHNPNAKLIDKVLASIEIEADDDALLVFTVADTDAAPVKLLRRPDVLARRVVAQLGLSLDATWPSTWHREHIPANGNYTGEQGRQ